MTAKPKTPTASGISRLLAAAGLRRSERQIGGYSSGFAVEKSYDDPGIVIVRHRFWSFAGGDYAPHLAKYTEAIEAAGYAVRTDTSLPRLIVTAKTEA